MSPRWCAYVPMEEHTDYEEFSPVCFSFLLPFPHLGLSFTFLSTLLSIYYTQWKKLCTPLQLNTSSVSSLQPLHSTSQNLHSRSIPSLRLFSTGLLDIVPMVARKQFLCLVCYLSVSFFCLRLYSLRLCGDFGWVSVTRRVFRVSSKPFVLCGFGGLYSRETDHASWAQDGKQPLTRG